jgi:hypothetical protein
MQTQRTTNAVAKAAAKIKQRAADARKAAKADALTPAEAAAYASAVRTDLSQWETAVLLLESAADTARSLREMLAGVSKLANADTARTFLAGRASGVAELPYNRARRCLELAHRDDAKKQKEAPRG